ncbi:MAG: Holliday junction resolvase RuvX [Dehalococcoidia bacterium]|nr:MAG: Holliday junction resolvase RuvX [Dehalococcoidia bacterium]
MRYLGLDIGDRWIGIALSDPLAKLASPHTILKRSNDIADIETISHIIENYDVRLIVVGLPLMMDGNLGIQAHKVEDFTQQLRGKLDIPVEFRDERLTTVSARRLMRASGNRKSRKSRDDAIAAAIMLQAFLDERQDQPR